MPTTIAAEEPLINNAQFLEELERLEHVPDPGFDSRSYADAFDALERGLPMDPSAREADAPERGLPMDPAAREAGAFDALEHGLPIDPAAREAGAFDAPERGLPMDPAAREASAFDALERGLPMDPSRRETDPPHHERSPLGEPYEPPVEHPALAEKHVPFLAAVFVLAACLTAGAATAALVFHDRVTQITARLANR